MPTFSSHAHSTSKLIQFSELPKPSTTSIIPFFEEYDDDIRPKGRSLSHFRKLWALAIEGKVAWISTDIFTPFLTEIPKNETKVILLEENYEPKVPKKNAKNNYNGRDRQFQKSQNNKSGDTKGFHRNGGDDSPYEKRYGSSGMSLCQNFRIFGVVLLTLVTLL